jgi:hypothetical protein
MYMTYDARFVFLQGLKKLDFIVIPLEKKVEEIFGSRGSSKMSFASSQLGL